MFACNAQFSMHWGRQCASPYALPDARPGGAPKGTSPGLGGGADSLFSIVLCCQNDKFCEFLLAMPSFQCIGGGSVPAPNALPDVGPGGAPKGASPGLGGGLNAIFCLVSGASSVGKRVAGVKQVWHNNVLLAVWRRYELRLLKLRELFSFADTLADFNAVEQRQPGRQGRVKRPNVHSSAK